MDAMKRGAVAVIFSSLRNTQDAAGYAAATAAMDAEAARQPGYLGMDAVRDESGAASPSAIGRTRLRRWPGAPMPRHSVIRDHGRAFWYDRYRVVVTEVMRSYVWERPPGPCVATEPARTMTMDNATPEQTTGKTLLETVPPAPAATGPTPVPVPVDDHAAQDAVIESTSVQGAPDDE